LARWAVRTVLLALLVAMAWAAFAQDTSLDGDWSGTLQTSAGARHLTLHVTQELSGAIAVSLEGVGETGWNYPGHGLLRGRHVSFRIFIPDATYEGTLSPDAMKMTGTLTQGVPVALEFTHEPGVGTPASTLEPTPSPAAALPPVALADLKPILDREMQAVVENGLLSKSTGGGVVIGILDHGERRIFSYGAAQPNSIFEIASITKTFTGLALAQMAVQRKVELDEPVRALLAESSTAKGEGAEITLLDLATHHSGLPSDPDNLEPFNPRNPYAAYDSTRLLGFVNGHGLTKPKGTEYCYCNLGFGLLGYALARRAGTSFEALVKTQITVPLHMDDTVVALSPEQQKRLIQGYDSKFNRASPWDFGVLAGEGALKSTAPDLLTYLDANLHPEKYAAGALSGTPLATLPTAIEVDHQIRADAGPADKLALAWFFHQDYFSHDGKSGGYNSRVAFYPAQDRAIVVLYNRDHLSPTGFFQLVDRISDNIEELLTGKPSVRVDFVYQDERRYEPAEAEKALSLRSGFLVAQTAPPRPPTLAQPAATAPAPGATIDAGNVESYLRFLPAAAELAVDHGFAMRIVPNQRLDWSGSFAAETERYAGQVRLDRDDHTVNYVAGMPFPIFSLDDPKAAVKIAYNWHMGPFMPDDFSLSPWGSFAYLGTDSSLSFVSEDDNDYVCDHFSFLRYAHRTEVDPRPTLGTNPDGVEWKARCDGWSSETRRENLGAKGIWVRFVDPQKVDQFYYYNGRLPVRGGNVESWDALDPGCRACHQPYWAYALPKTEEFSYRLLGTTPMLACLTADQEPAGILVGDKGARLGTEPFQLRNAYILEMIPLLPGYENLRTLVYIDTEAYVWLAAEFFDGSERTEAAFPLWRAVPSPSGGYRFELAGEFYFPTGATNVRHAALSGMSLFRSTPKLFFRSLVPAHGGFLQKINTGQMQESAFDYKAILP
jgi:D-alanyl-D-alanine-carboxypeptidase/D-alanyl-D-alanine-endopeptidase